MVRCRGGGEHSNSIKALPNGGNITPNLAFRRHLALQCMYNTIGTDTGNIGRPVRAYRRPQIVEINLEKVPKTAESDKQAKKEKFPSKNIRSSTARNIQNGEI